MLLSDYMNAALARAVYEHNHQDGLIHGCIPGFDGVVADGDTLLDCRHHLAELLEDWINFHLSRGVPVPIVDGIELPLRDVF